MKKKLLGEEINASAHASGRKTRNVFDPRKERAPRAETILGGYNCKNVKGIRVLLRRVASVSSLHGLYPTRYNLQPDLPENPASTLLYPAAPALHGTLHDDVFLSPEPL